MINCNENYSPTGDERREGREAAPGETLLCAKNKPIAFFISELSHKQYRFATAHIVDIIQSASAVPAAAGLDHPFFTRPQGRKILQPSVGVRRIY
ncbi:MAG: hypothetical protein LBL46_04830 [Rickettsiales bacterium]|nr:hypothetical protein [Rickettsiales bacterium]